MTSKNNEVRVIILSFNLKPFYVERKQLNWSQKIEGCVCDAWMKEAHLWNGLCGLTGAVVFAPPPPQVELDIDEQLLPNASPFRPRDDPYGPG